jgi:serine/threonine protein kinase
MYTECGTPGYMAPEMTANKGYDPVHTDIWACGVILFIMLAGFPPFQSPTLSDWWFAKLAANKHHLFWAAHCRTAVFSEAAKDLINKILVPEASRRLSIQEIKNHPWFNGPILTDANLFTELNRRKNRVDYARERKKAQERAGAQMKDLVNDSPITSDQRGVMRSLEELPAACPNMLTFERPGKQMMSVAPAADDFFFVPAPAGKPPVYDPSASTVVYTRFESTESASAVFDRLASLFADLKMTYSKNKPAFQLTASMVTAIGKVTFVASIFSDPQDANKVIVEFRRRKGDSMQYRLIFFEICNQLQDIIILSKALADNPGSASSSSSAAPAASTASSSPAAPAAAASTAVGMDVDSSAKP